MEDLHEEVVGGLHALTKEHLLDICDFLQISGEERADVREKSRMSLVTHIMKHLEREDLADLEDQGMSELLALRDKVAELTSTGIHNQPSEMQREPKENSDRVSPGNLPGPPVSPIGQESPHQPINMPSTQPSQPSNDQLQQQNPCWRRDFKISGQIGEPGQKDRLTFSSLARQIEHGLKRHYSEIDIIDAVIRAISPGLQLRSYLEGKPQLTLPTLRRILRSHFQEKSATELFKQLASEAQNSKETPQCFLMRVLDLRQKVLFASQESESGLKYDPGLVQRMCLHTLLTGLQNDNIRMDMQPLLLDSETSDELMLERLNIASATEMERRNKKKGNTLQAANVSAVQAEEMPSAKCPEKEMKSKGSTGLLTEIQELKTGVASLKGLSAEIAQIKETLQQTRFQPQSEPPLVVWPERNQQPLASPPQSYSAYVQPQAPAPLQFGHDQPRAPRQMQYGAPFQMQHGPSQYTSYPPRAPRRCFTCQQSGMNERCMHCYRCGSAEHFQAGCRNRGIRPAGETPLNREGLSPRDGC